MPAADRPKTRTILTDFASPVCAFVHTVSVHRPRFRCAFRNSAIRHRPVSFYHATANHENHENHRCRTLGPCRICRNRHGEPFAFKLDRVGLSRRLPANPYAAVVEGPSPDHVREHPGGAPMTNPMREHNP